MKQLNEMQEKAVLYNDGASLIIAGAGSGKTRVLTYKIAYLLQCGVDPHKIMALTFTNKAAKEMKERIAGMIGEEEANNLWIGTFHSIFAKILRLEAYFIGWNSQFSIYDETDKKNLIKNIIIEMNFENDNYKPSTICSKISMLKNKLINPALYMLNQQLIEEDVKAKLQHFGDIYKEYQDRLKTANAMDFDDLLMNTYLLFAENEAIREHYQNIFDLVLVDEFQDTNAAQMKILLQLCQEKQNLYAVGDDAQSIYSFRGANINNILFFQQYFPNMAIFKLEQNYRSTQYIVNAANSLIHHNISQIQKNVFSKENVGNKVIFTQYETDREEAAQIVNCIKNIKRQDKCNFSDFALLYRNNAQSRCLEEALMQNNIPYVIHGNIGFYQRKEVKDVIAYFRLVSNCCDDEAFMRIINYPARGIGNVTVERMKQQALIHNVPLYQVACNPARYNLVLNKSVAKKIEDFCKMIDNYIILSAKMDALQLGEKIMNEIGIYEAINRGSNEDVAKLNNLEEIVSSLESFVRSREDQGRKEDCYLYQYLQDVALLTDETAKNDDDRVNLMTIHASKGLEFSTVFVVALEENIFPSNRTATSAQELEEERRLLYVAITRAEKRCFLSSAQKRWVYGSQQENNISRFISEIDEKYIDKEEIGIKNAIVDNIFV